MLYYPFHMASKCPCNWSDFRIVLGLAASEPQLYGLVELPIIYLLYFSVCKLKISNWIYNIEKYNIFVDYILAIWSWNPSLVHGLILRQHALKLEPIGMIKRHLNSQFMQHSSRLCILTSKIILLPLIITSPYDDLLHH